MSVKLVSFIISFLTVSLIAFQGCSKPESYYYEGVGEQKDELKNLFNLFEKTEGRSESRFIVIQQIVKILYSSGNNDKLNYFLTTYVENNPDDPFNAYHLLVVARNYMEQGAYPLAVLYFERILKNYPDLLIGGKSVHYICLKELINLVSDPEVKVNYYKELIARFGEEIDRGLIYYYLAKTYEELGEWDLAMQAYSTFLKYPNTIVPGVTDVRHKVKVMVDFYNYKQITWTMESLDELVKQVKWAIYRNDVNRLRRYMSKVDFFTMSWEQKETIADEQFIQNIGVFLNPRVSYSSNLDRDSNAREAYLKTTGWSYRIITWYLYFRKIHFPADPEKHGDWEWAGIYFGDKPFAGGGRS